MRIVFQMEQEAGTPESIFENPWFTAPVLIALVAVLLLLLIVYMPRTREILDLQRQLSEARSKIDHMSKNQARAELEHVADLEQLRGDHMLNVKSIEAEAQDAEQRAKNAEARTQQSEDLRRQIAEAADKLTKEAQA